MRCGRWRGRVGVLLLVAAVATPAPGAIHEGPKLTVEADLRARIETDRDSHDAQGTEREDRTRLRARARITMLLRPAEAWSFRLRLRSGSDDSQQSPHVTILDFDDNDTGDVEFNWDVWSLRWSRRSAWITFGRDAIPFWKPNEMTWDDDVTPLGLSGGWSKVRETDRFDLCAGYTSLPVGMRRTTGNLAGAQLAYSRESGAANWKTGLALYEVDANPSDPDAALLLDGNGGRDYRILAGSFEVRLDHLGRGLTLGGDLLSNLEHYSPTDADPYTVANREQRDGFVGSLTYGTLARRHDRLAAYSYVRIEALAVVASYAQDDWVRWGTASETRSSNLKGHELRFGYQVLDNANLLFRLFLVDSITSVEDGNRARVDFNLRF